MTTPNVSATDVERGTLADPMGRTVARRTAYVGRRHADRARVFVTLTVRERQSRPGALTIAHDPAPATYLELSVMTSVVRYREREVGEVGQGRDNLNSIGIAYGWTRGDVRSLAALWERWHVNGLKAACAHMADALAELAPDYDARRHITCPETGYQYGRAWLLELLPADVVAEIRRLIDLPAGDVPDYVTAGEPDLPWQD